MLRKLILILLAVILTSCSALPFEVKIIPRGEQLNPGASFMSVEGDTESKAAVQVPTCTTPICPTCPAPIQVTPITPTRTSTTPPTVAPTRTSTTAPTKTPTKVPTSSGRPYTLQPDSPLYTKLFFRPERNCNWLGVAGQVFDKNGVPVKNLVVVIEGTLGGTKIDNLGMTGTSPAYGPGGFEIDLSNKLEASSNTLKITVFDLAGKPVSDTVFFSTFADCNRNLAVINFKAR